MISDDEVIKTFREFAEINLELTDDVRSAKGTQLLRGSPYAEMNCGRHLYVFSKTNIIPEYCFKCYKVFIEPRNVIELFKLAMVFGEPGFPFANLRKCMVEQRPYCSGSYKGFIYCKSLSEANLISKTVKKIVAEKISPDVTVEIKRGCSEYAKAYPKYERLEPESSIMRYKKKWKQQEDLIDATINFLPKAADASDSVQYVGRDGSTAYSGADVFCFQHWLRYAATIGDTSYLRINPQPLQPLSSLSARPPFLDKIPVTIIGD